MATTTTTVTSTLQNVCESTTPEPYYPWVQQPRAAYAFAYFACAVIGLAATKFVLTAIHDRARYF